MSQPSLYQPTHPPQPQESFQQQQATPYPPSQGLSPAFLASLQSLYPSVSPTSKTAQDIAAYLNGTASISYESRLDSGLQQQMNPNVAPPQSLVQARAIETLLAQAKHAQQQFQASSSSPSTAASSPQAVFPTYPFPNNPYLTNHQGLVPSLFPQQPIQPPSLPFNLFPYQQYLQQHQQRFQPQYNNFSNFQHQQQQQQHQQQYQTPFYPSLPFLAPGEQQHTQYNEVTSSSSTNSTIESPSLPELGQEFIYDPSFDLSGGSNDFGDANVSSYGVASQLASGYDFTKSAQEGGYASVQQQPPFDMASLDTDSPLTSSSPSSSFAPPSPYAFNNVAESSFSNSESEYDFQSCSVSVVGSNNDRTVSSSSSTPVGPGGEVEKKKHVCEVCHRGFARAFNLKSHMHTHAPNRYKPFLCPSKDCSRSFSRSHDMERHRSGIHQEGPLAAKAGLIPEDSPAAAPGVKASAKKRSVRGASSI